MRYYFGKVGSSYGQEIVFPKHLKISDFLGDVDLCQQCSEKLDSYLNHLVYLMRNGKNFNEIFQS